MRIFIVTVLLMLALTACQPSDNRPGLWLSGEPESFPADWRFANEFKLISIQVATPYLLPHSVTIWCVQVDGILYISARAPASKNWPGWVEDDPNVRLKLGERLFDVSLKHLQDPALLSSVGKAYVEKYELKGTGIGEPSRTWRVDPRT